MVIQVEDLYNKVQILADHHTEAFKTLNSLLQWKGSVCCSTAAGTVIKGTQKVTLQ